MNAKSQSRDRWERLQLALCTYFEAPTDASARDEAFVATHEAIGALSRYVTARHFANRGRVTPISDRLVAEFWERRRFTELVFAQFDPDRNTSFKTWCTTVLQNLLVDWYRRNRTELGEVPLTVEQRDELDNEWRTAVDDLADCDVFQMAARSSESLADTKLTMDRLREAINNLPPKLRQVIVASQADTTQADVAASLGVSLATYKRRYSQGLLVLRLAFAPDPSSN